MVRPRPDPRRRHRAANVSLDLIGQARLLYQLAATLKGGDATEDKLAYFRDAHEFRNYTLLELPHHGPLVGYARRPRLRHHHRAQLPVQRADGAGVGRRWRSRPTPTWRPSPPSRSRSALPPAPRARLAGAPGRRHRRIARPRAGGGGPPVPYTESSGRRARPKPPRWPPVPSTCGPARRLAIVDDALAEATLSARLPRLRHRGQAGPALRAPGLPARRDAEPGPRPPGRRW
jgi:hypothetical protein